MRSLGCDRIEFIGFADCLAALSFIADHDDETSRASCARFAQLGRFGQDL
jgi:hypothetical protein